MPYGRILLLDEDASLRKLLIDHFEMAGMEGCGFSRIDDIMYSAASKADIMIVSAGVAGERIAAVIGKLKGIRDAPIVVTVSSSESVEATVSELDVRLVLHKPFDAAEVARQISYVLSTCQDIIPPDADTAVSYRGLCVDVGKYTVTVDGADVAFAPKEIELLYLLLMAPRHVFSRGELTSRVWGTVLSDSRTISVHINRIKKKIGGYAALINNVRGVGYSFIPEE